MTESDQSPEGKAIAMLRGLVGSAADQLVKAVPEAQRIAQEALIESFGEETSSDIAFHMTDWASDAAFITAFLLYPERFNAEEIRDGVTNFLVHVPNHVAAAAKLHGYPIQDVFEVGALENSD